MENDLRDTYMAAVSGTLFRRVVDKAVSDFEREAVFSSSQIAEKIRSEMGWR